MDLTEFTTASKVASRIVSCFMGIPPFSKTALTITESLSPWLCFYSRLNIVHMTMVAKQNWLSQTF